MLAGDGQLDELIARAKKFGDTLLFKCIRNIAQFNPNCQESFQSYLGDFAVMVQQCGENTDMMLEIIGTLVYIHTDRWEHVIMETDFINFLTQTLANEYYEDDILLECIMLIATICRTEKVSEMIANSYLVQVL